MSLEVYYLRDGMSVTRGSATLRVIHNSMNILDLLVREAIQNSADAANKKEETPFVGLHFDFGSFQPKRFNALFSPEVQQVLDRRFNTETADFLAIRDFNTVGLNEDVIPTNMNSRSNFCRLVYDTGVAQEQEGAGGNWGYGKSVYYNIGRNIVVFYSRFKEGSCYKSRLIITLVEDEKSPTAILKEAGIGNAAGKAWWGDSLSKDVNSGSQWVLPIEDENRISEILALFGVKPYEQMADRSLGEKTGTTVIIPYINQQKILEDYRNLGVATLENPEKKDIKTLESLYNNLPNALAYSILRWYAMRIGNIFLDDYNAGIHSLGSGAWDKMKIPLLRVFVNDTLVGPSAWLGGGDPLKKEVARFFIAMQSLYNIALHNTFVQEFCKKKKKTPWEMPPRFRELMPDVSVDEIRIRQIFTNQSVGSLVSGFFQPKQSISPYFLTGQLNNIEKNSCPATLFFLRTPGMVVSYSSSDSWLKGVPDINVSEGKILLACFYPCCSNKFNNPPKETLWNLGEYLRYCEKAEHSSWNDHSGINVVGKIKSHCAARLRAKLGNAILPVANGAHGTLAVFLGKRLLNKEGKFKKTIRQTPKPPSKGRVRLDIRSCKIDESGQMLLDFVLKIGQGCFGAQVEAYLVASDKSISPEKWYEKTDLYDGEFPISMSIISLSPEDGVNLSAMGWDGHEGNVTGIRFDIEKSAEISEITGTFSVELKNPILQFKLIATALTEKAE